jgi:hypothetical protein
VPYGKNRDSQSSQGLIFLIFKLNDVCNSVYAQGTIHLLHDTEIENLFRHLPSLKHMLHRKEGAVSVRFGCPENLVIILSFFTTMFFQTSAIK